MKVAIQLCSPETFDILQYFSEKYADEGISSILFNLIHSFDENLVSCIIFNEPIECSKIIVPILTDYGWCMSFNTLNMVDFAKTA